MIAENIRQLQAANPFEPYTVCTSDGKELRVKHPDYLLISPGNHTVYLYSDEVHYTVVAVANITRLVPGAAKKPTRKRA